MVTESTILRRRSAAGRQQVGVVLVFVLLLLVLLSIMGASFSHTMRVDASLVHNAKVRLQTRVMTDAAVAYTQFMLTQPSPERRWRTDARSYAMSLEGQVLDIRVQDEAGRFNLNRIDKDILVWLIEPLVSDPHQAVAVADCILDWRDADDVAREFGAEAGEEEGQPVYAPANRPFESLRELLRVQGMTEALYRQLSPFVTVHTRQHKVDLAVAPDYVLDRLPDSSPGWVQQVLAIRDSDSQAAAFPLVPSAMEKYASSKTSQRGQVISITIIERRPNGGTLSNKVLMRRNLRDVFPLFTEIEREPLVMDERQTDK